MEIDEARWDLTKKTANDLVKDFTSPPIPVSEIAMENGVDVVYANFGKHSKKVAGFCDFREEKIYVNNADPIKRQFFTVAHELGHWLLHQEIFEKNPDEYSVLARLQSTESDNPLEQEANYFAANLLVPDQLLNPVRQSPVSALANVFGVDVIMMTRRLKDAHV